MDVAAAKTFLAIVEAGNFVAAAQRLHVTQSTVSARIKTLESALGRELFIRNKAGCEMTPAGSQFHRYARAIVRAWEEGRHQVAVPERFETVLSVGGQYSLWNRLLTQWIPRLQKASPRTALRAEIGTPARLMREMAEGVLDLAVMYSPEHRPGLRIDELMEDELILVTAVPDAPIGERYVFVDWGESFREWHAAHHELLHNPGLTLDLGALGINHILNVGAAGYFPKRIAAPYLKNGLLAEVKDAPVFPYPAYVVHQEDYTSPRIMDIALSTLRETAALAAEGGLPQQYWA